MSPLSFLVGVLVGAALMRGFPVFRQRLRARRISGYLVAAAGVLATVALAAAALYLAIGSRAGQNHAAAPAAHAAAAMASATLPGEPSTGRSMESEVAALEARLARQGGSADDWTLLAQAYEFLGRPDDAKRARTHVANPAAPSADVTHMSPESLAAAIEAAGQGGAPAPAGVATVQSQSSVKELLQRVASNRRDAEAWAALAELRRRDRDYPAARDAYAQLVQLDAMSAQSWADYADTLGSLHNGSLGGEAGRAIDRALALDAANPKALWLKASQLYEQKRYAESLTWWQKLRAQLPGDSPDAQIVARNISEAAALAGRAVPDAPGSGAAAGSAAQPGSAASSTALFGTVSLDARLAARVPADAILFIYAKSADAPGPPLAVLRTNAGTWPVSFRLDDSMAMLPSRRLSQFDRVIVEARISRSGQATPAPGDLYVTSEVLRPASAPKLALVINREIG